MTTTIDNAAIIDQVAAASDRWIAMFNQGDTTGCVAAYHPDAVIEAKPVGTFQGHLAIDAFWRPFMAAGAGELVYSRRRYQVQDEHNVLLSAEWSMNVGRGIITKEHWQLEGDRWILRFDAFEIQEQYQT